MLVGIIGMNIFVRGDNIFVRSGNIFVTNEKLYFIWKQMLVGIRYEYICKM